MRDRRLAKIRNLIRRLQWRVSGRLLRKLETGEVHEEDAVVSVMNGHIRETRDDEEATAVDDRKYVITGRDRAGLPFESVGKIIEGEQGQEYFFITAYARR